MIKNFIGLQVKNQLFLPDFDETSTFRQIDRKILKIKFHEDPLSENLVVAQVATYTTHNKHKRRTASPSVGFEPRSQQSSGCIPTARPLRSA